MKNTTIILKKRDYHDPSIAPEEFTRVEVPALGEIELIIDRDSAGFPVLSSASVKPFDGLNDLSESLLSLLQDYHHKSVLAQMASDDVRAKIFELKRFLEMK